MSDPFISLGFQLQEQSGRLKDLDVYLKGDVALICMKKHKADKKAMRVAANHLDTELLSELGGQLELLAQHRNLKAVILASGHKVTFSRGAKIELLLEFNQEQCRSFITAAQKSLLDLQNFPKPLIAAISGLTLGGGLELAMGCDYRIASSRENVIFGLPETSLGIIPAMGGTQNLPRLIGAERALDVIAHARTDITPDVALDYGLVDQVTVPEELFQAAYDWAVRGNLKKTVPMEDSTNLIWEDKEIQGEIKSFLSGRQTDPAASAPAAPLSAALTSFIFEKTKERSYLTGLRYEREALCFLFDTPDCREGIQAMAGERKPLFTGQWEG